MPNCDFYATIEDHEPLLTWLFAENTCHVYESYSDHELPLRQFDCPEEVLSQFDRSYENGVKWNQVHLQLYVLGASPPFVPRRISLNPEKCDGATFRYAAEGLGMVQLYLGSQTQDGVVSSHTNHNSQKRAEAWSPVISELADAGAWNFSLITSFSSRLNRQIRKLGVGKIGSRPVLPGALNLWNSGSSLLPFNHLNASVVMNNVPPS